MTKFYRSLRSYWWKQIRNSLQKKFSTQYKYSKIRAQTTETCQDCQLKKLIWAFCLYRESIYNTWYQAEFSSVFYVFVFFDIPMQKNILHYSSSSSKIKKGEGFFCLKRYTCSFDIIIMYFSTCIRNKSEIRWGSFNQPWNHNQTTILFVFCCDFVV